MRSLAPLAALLLAGCATVANGGRASIALDDAPASLTVLDNGAPAQRDAEGRVLVDSRSPHVLTLRADGREATVVAESHPSAKWVLADLIFPFAGAWLVDGVTGRWNEFGSIDVTRALSDGK